MLRWFPNSKLLLHASHAANPILNSSKLPPVADLIFLIIDKTIINSKFRCLYEATPYHHNVFTLTLFLPEGRAGVAWEPSNKIMFFLPPRKIKCLGFKGLIWREKNTMRPGFWIERCNCEPRQTISLPSNSPVTHRGTQWFTSLMFQRGRCTVILWQVSNLRVIRSQSGIGQ
jgi:hypothetical protein